MRNMTNGQNENVRTEQREKLEAMRMGNGNSGK